MRDQERGFPLPVHPGLVNRARLTLQGLDVDVFSPQSVLVRRESPAESTNTVASLVLAPSMDTWIGWRPRTRDTRREKAVFFAELSQLFVPGPGVIEGWHDVRIRPAQGELAELVFQVPILDTGYNGKIITARLHIDFEVIFAENQGSIGKKFGIVQVVPTQGARFISPINPKIIAQSQYVAAKITGEINAIFFIDAIIGFCVKIVKIQAVIAQLLIIGQCQKSISVGASTRNQERTFVFHNRAFYG